jgi:hypothetical protein
MTMSEAPLFSPVDSIPEIMLSQSYVYYTSADLEDHFWECDALRIAFDKTYRMDDNGNLISGRENMLDTFFNSLAEVGSIRYVLGKEKECFPEATRNIFCHEIFSFMKPEVFANPAGCAFLASLMPQYLDDFLREHPRLDKVRDEYRIIRSFIQEINSTLR